MGQNIVIRKAFKKDIDTVVEIYEKIHDLEEQGLLCIGWVRNVYPTRETAEASYKEGTLYVLENDGLVKASGIINQKQLPEYEGAKWNYPAKASEVMVLHTLTVDPFHMQNHFGQYFIQFYEKYAKDNGCRYLRIDTQEKNETARQLYHKLGYQEVGIVKADFNGISEVSLVCLEKKL